MPAETIYLDHNATTPLRPEAAEAYLQVEQAGFGNPASAHGVGRTARRYLELAREKVAHALGALPQEVIWTSSATESNNLALHGWLAQSPMGAEFIAASFEHPCILGPLEQAERQGRRWVRGPVPSRGVVQPAEWESLFSPQTFGLVLMLANHETGARQPVRELVQRWQGRGLFHTDAAQVVGKEPVDFHHLGVTSLTASAHKFGGPKGCGLLLVREGTELVPLIRGGHQQRGRRPGTESPALAYATAIALEASLKDATHELARLAAAKADFVARLEELAGPVLRNGTLEDSLPTTVNLSFPGCRADVLLMQLDLAGVACSTGSACSSGSLTPSIVLRTMGTAEESLRSALRFSFSWRTTNQELQIAAERIARFVRLQREAPPQRLAAASSASFHEAKGSVTQMP